MVCWGGGKAQGEKRGAGGDRTCIEKKALGGGDEKRGAGGALGMGEHTSKGKREEPELKRT